MKLNPLQKLSLYKTAYTLILIGLVANSCKKEGAKPSSEKAITSFVFKAGNNQGIVYDALGEISQDTIRVGVNEDISLTNLAPTIGYKGIDLTPGSLTPQNFTNPVKYMVTAEDGSKRTYTVIVNHLASTNTITSFVLKVQDNPALSKDVIGLIHGDSISIHVPSNVYKNNLVPTITHTGKSINPESSSITDLSKPAAYTVTAENGNTRKYSVFTSTNKALYFGSTDNNVYALDAADGSLLWKFATKGQISSSPTLHNNVLFVGSSDSYLYAFDANTGNLKWTFKGKGAFTSSSVIHNETVFITDYIFQHPGHLFAIDEKSGLLKWEYQLGYVVTGGPTVSNGTVYVGDNGFGVYAVDETLGTLKWRTSIGVSKGNPSVVNGIVYAGGEGVKVYALDATNGEVKWSFFDNNLGSYSSPTVYKGAVYVNGYTGTFCAIDSATGSLKWQYNNNGKVYFSAAIGGDGLIYAGDNHGIVYALNATTGIPAWSYDAEGTGNTVEKANPTFANGILYIGNFGGNLTAFNGANGSPLWKYKTKGAVYSGPCVVDADGNVFHSGDSGEQQ